MLLIQIPITKNYVPRFFAIHGQFYKICKKYINLRPKNIEKHKRIFLNFFNGKCTRQPIGINTMRKIPKQIASWMSLPDPQLYTGHSFRRTLAILLIDGGGDLTDMKRHGGWKSSTVAESYINKSLHDKQEIHKKIIKSIALKTINDGVTDKNNYQIKSSSEPQIINRVHKPKPSITTTSFKNVNLESADESRQQTDKLMMDFLIMNFAV